MFVASMKLKERDERSGMVVRVGLGWKIGSVPSKRKIADWIRNSTRDGVQLIVSNNSLNGIPMRDEE